MGTRRNDDEKTELELQALETLCDGCGGVASVGQCPVCSAVSVDKQESPQDTLCDGCGSRLRGVDASCPSCSTPRQQCRPRTCPPCLPQDYAQASSSAVASRSSSPPSSPQSASGSSASTSSSSRPRRSTRRQLFRDDRPQASASVARRCGSVPAPAPPPPPPRQEQRPFECPTCPKSFSSKFKLVRHSLIHSDHRQYTCSDCGRTFHRKDHLKNHAKVHSPTKRRYRCRWPACDKEYSSALSLRKHEAGHAAEDGDLQCRMCGLLFDAKEAILFHLKVHAGSRTVKTPADKKYRCDQCGRRFFTGKDVRRHSVVHTGRRDFLCQSCPQRFGRKDHLVRHMKKSHAAPSPSPSASASQGFRKRGAAAAAGGSGGGKRATGQLKTATSVIEEALRGGGGGGVAGTATASTSAEYTSAGGCEVKDEPQFVGAGASSDFSLDDSFILATLLAPGAVPTVATEEQEQEQEQEEEETRGGGRGGDDGEASDAAAAAVVVVEAAAASSSSSTTTPLPTFEQAFPPPPKPPS